MLCVEPRCPEDASLGSHLSIADSSGPETGPLLCIRIRSCGASVIQEAQGLGGFWSGVTKGHRISSGVTKS